MSGRIPLLSFTIFILILGDMATHLIRTIRQSSDCATPSGQVGACIPVTQCPELALSQSFDDLTKARCGDSIGQARVCCSTKPVTTSPTSPPTRPTPTRLGSARILPLPSGSDCATPSGQVGACLPVTQCPELALSWSFEDLVKARCGDNVGEPRVCCSAKPVNKSRPAPPMKHTPSRLGSVRLLTLPSDCGLPEPSAFRIVSYGGKNASISSYPWTVLLFIDRGLGYYPDCGGSLISKRHVVTAAHCVWSKDKKRYFDPTQLVVRLGEQNWRQDDDGVNPVNMKVILVEPHEAFQSAEFRNDIAILTLEEDVEFTKNINPICLPDGETRNKDLTGTNAIVTGWGIIDNDNHQADTLQEIELKMISNDECSNIYSGLSDFNNVYLCAGNMGADACRGDSGGPLSQPGTENRYLLIGIVSFGRKGCGGIGVPGVYTRVSEFIDWISSKVIST